MAGPVCLVFFGERAGHTAAPLSTIALVVLFASSSERWTVRLPDSYRVKSAGCSILPKHADVTWMFKAMPLST